LVGDGKRFSLLATTVFARIEKGAGLNATYVGEEERKKDRSEKGGIRRFGRLPINLAETVL